MSPQRVLLVDDEPGILTTFQQILKGDGFEVTTAGSVAEGLALIQARPFDALITDLNIGEPGDGFTLVSAMRRTQPDAVTFIITGFPAFDTALEAIRSQVDDYFVKPMDIGALLRALHNRLDAPKRHVPLSVKRVGVIVQARKHHIVSDWLVRFRRGCEQAAGFGDEELVNSVLEIVEEMARFAITSDREVSESAVEAAKTHGKTRCRQGFPIDVFLRESRYLRQAVLQHVHSAMLEVNLSFVFEDLAAMSESLDAQLEISLSSYVACREQQR